MRGKFLQMQKFCKCSIHWKSSRVAHDVSKQRWVQQTTCDTAKVQNPSINETQLNLSLYSNSEKDVVANGFALLFGSLKD